MKTAEWGRDRAWRLFVFRRAMAQLSVALVLCALIAGAYGQRIYVTYAFSAAGVLLLARAWWEYCAWRDGKPVKREGGVPYLLRKEKGRRLHRPAFLMDGRDFDDDLTPYTAVGAQDFSDAQCRLAQVVSCVCSGGLMVLLSFIL